MLCDNNKDVDMEGDNAESSADFIDSDGAMELDDVDDVDGDDDNDRNDNDDGEDDYKGPFIHYFASQ